MQIFNIEATDMGCDQGEIADKVLDYVDGVDFKSPDEFNDLEGRLITRACNEMGWASVPQVGGLLVSWGSPDGAFA
jgi:hypothetical protein